LRSWTQPKSKPFVGAESPCLRCHNQKGMQPLLRADLRRRPNAAQAGNCDSRGRGGSLDPSGTDRWPMRWRRRLAHSKPFPTGRWSRSQAMAGSRCSDFSRLRLVEIIGHNFRGGSQWEMVSKDTNRIRPARFFFRGASECDLTSKIAATRVKTRCRSWRNISNRRRWL
jgi:hypothetical protein